MKNQFNEKQIIKINKLELELRELWECLTQSEQRRRAVFYKFQELQQLIQTVQKRNQTLNKKEIKNEHSI